MIAEKDEKADQAFVAAVVELMTIDIESGGNALAADMFTELVDGKVARLARVCSDAEAEHCFACSRAALPFVKAALATYAHTLQIRHAPELLSSNAELREAFVALCDSMLTSTATGSASDLQLREGVAAIKEALQSPRGVNRAVARNVYRRLCEAMSVLVDLAKASDPAYFAAMQWLGGARGHEAPSSGASPHATSPQDASRKTWAAPLRKPTALAPSPAPALPDVPPPDFVVMDAAERTATGLDSRRSGAATPVRTPAELSPVPAFNAVPLVAPSKRGRDDAAAAASSTPSKSAPKQPSAEPTRPTVPPFSRPHRQISVPRTPALVAADDNDARTRPTHRLDVTDSPVAAVNRTPVTAPRHRPEAALPSVPRRYLRCLTCSLFHREELASLGCPVAK